MEEEKYRRVNWSGDGKYIRSHGEVEPRGMWEGETALGSYGADMLIMMMASWRMHKFITLYT